MNGAEGRDRDAIMGRRRAVLEDLQALRAQSDNLQRLLDALKEQRAVVHEERLSVTAEYRLLVDDDGPEGWVQQVLEQERALLQEESALAQEWLRLLDEQRQLRQKRLAMLAEQAELFEATRHSGHAGHPAWQETCLD